MVVGVGVIVGVHLAEREAPGDTCEDGGLQGSAHRDSSGRDGVVVVGAVVVVVVVVEVVKVSGDTCDEGGGRAPPTGLRWDGTGSFSMTGTWGYRALSMLLWPGWTGW